MLHTMPIIMLKVVALIFQCLARLIVDLPPGSSTSHEVKDSALPHPQVRHPTDMWDLITALLPVLNKIDAHIGVGSMQGDLVDKAKAMHKPRGAVVSLIVGHASRVLCRLHLLEQIGMIAVFAPQDRVEFIPIYRTRYL